MTERRGFQSQAIKVGYMAGREIPVSEIGAAVDCPPALIRNALQLAGISVPNNGRTMLVSVPADPFQHVVDEVGRLHKINRDKVLRAILITTLRADISQISEIIERGGFSNVR